MENEKIYRLKDDGSLAWLFFHTVRCLQRSGRSGYSQQRILNILDEKGPLAQKTLQEMLGIQAGSLSELCGKLEEKKMIERTRDENDRRNVIVRITEEGRKMKREIRKHKDEKIFSALSTEEREQLRRILGKLNGHVSADDENETEGTDSQ